MSTPTPPPGQDPNPPTYVPGQAPTPQEEPYIQPQWPAAPQSPKTKTRKVVLLTLIGVFALICVVSTIAGAIIGDSDQKQAAAKQTTTQAATTKPPTPTTVASTQSAPATTTAPKPAPKPAPVVYKKITDREWKLIAKNPDGYVGKTYVVYGWVTQFDAATGDDTFRADVGGVQRRPSYGFVDYPTNTVLTGDTAKLSKLVEGDLFRAEVTVGGSLDYDTQIGGQTTVPTLIISSIKVTGSLA